MYFTSRRINRNFEKNRLADLRPAMDRRGLLNGQGREALRSLAFGFADVGRSGCESIAVYNALLLLDRPRPLPEIIRAMEKGGYLRFGGHLGAVPYFQPLMRRYGAATRLVTPAALRREADSGQLKPGSVFLMAIWNRRFCLHKGLHTFTVLYDPAESEPWTAFNRFNSDTAERHYAHLDDILRNGTHAGAWLVLYRVIPLD